MGTELLDLIEVPGIDTPAELVGKIQEDTKLDPITIVDDDEKKVAEEVKAPEEEKAPAPKEEKKHELSDEEYSRAVQRRIDKEVGRRKAIEEELVAVKARNDLLAEELNKKTTEYSDTREKELLKLRADALESGELDKFATLSDELIDLKLLRQKPVVSEEKPVTKRVEVEDDVPDLHPAARAWIDENGWYNNPKHAERARRAEQIQNDLLSSGYELSDDLYSELDRRLFAQDRPKAQEIEDEIPSGTRVKQPAKPGHIAAPSSADAGTPPKPKSGDFTQRDIAVMRMSNLDPNNPKHREAYLKRRSN